MSYKADLAAEKMAKECQGKDYLIPFEEYLTSICTADAVADKILADGKTLQGAFDKMKEIARKRQHGGCAYIPPEEGFEIIREYYGITGADVSPVPVKHVDADVIDITDFL